MPRGKRGLQQLDSRDQDARRVRKRERYTRIACESCKARKVKCSGSLPCSRCAELSSECKYNDYIPQPYARSAVNATGQSLAPRHTSVSPHHSSPQDSRLELQQLLSNMRGICDDIQKSTSRFIGPATATPSLKRRRPSFVDDRFLVQAHDSSFMHSLGMAKAILEEAGVLAVSDESPNDNDNLAGMDDAADSDENLTTILNATQPLLEVGHESASQHFASFKEIIYPFYPCIDLEVARKTLDAFFTSSSPSRPERIEDIAIDLVDVEISKVVVAVGMLAKDKGDHPLCLDLEAHLIWNTDVVMKRDRALVEDVILSTLLLALELGIDSAKAYGECNRKQSFIGFLRRLTACICDLNTRCSLFSNFSTRLRLHDLCVNDDVQDIYPYLSMTLKLNRIQTELSEALSTVSGENKPSSGTLNERLEYLDFRAKSMEERITSAELFPDHLDVVPAPAMQTVVTNVLRMRLTFTRMSSYSWCLSSPASWTDNTQQAQTLIQLTQSVVEQYQKTAVAAGDAGLDRLWGPVADRILIKAIYCMIIAATHNPSVYGPQCRQSFHAALALWKASSHRSAEAGTRTWYSTEELKKIGDKVQMRSLDDLHLGSIPGDDGFIETGSGTMQASACDDASFLSFGPLSDESLAFLGMASQDTPNFYGQMPALQFPAYPSL